MTFIRKILSVCVLLSCQFLMGNPVADFSMSVSQGCVPLTIKFTNNSTGTGLRYSWSFGNGNQSTLKDPSAIYYRSGKFTVTLTVTDANGKQSSKTFNPIRVFSNPVASFISDTVGCIGQPLAFTSTSTPGDTSIVKWTWDFGDGQLGSGNNPQHAYTYSTKFSIGLTVVDGFGCKSLAVKPQYVRIKPSPKASFKLDKDYSCKLPGVFNATNTSPGTNTYSWVCSDGKSGTGTSFSTNISSYGKYNITLNVANGGCTTSVVKSVNVQKLISKFTLDQGSICVGAEVKFENITTPDNSSLKFSWDFGDGLKDTAKSPKHTYISTGKYNVKLSVSNGVCNDSTVQTYTVNPVPNVDISVVDTVGCKAPFTAKFNITGSEYVSSVWKFGDGTSEKYFRRGDNIQHQYNKKGSYPVSAVVTNSYGCGQELDLEEKIHVGTQDVEINPKEYNACLPSDTVYNAELNFMQPVESISWLFSDSGRMYYGQKVKKHFEKAGNFSAIVKVRTYMGCEISDTASISVGHRYVPTFNIHDYDVCAIDKISFENTTDDSLKKFLKFGFETIHQYKGDTGTTLNIRDSVFESHRGGRHVFKMYAIHFGCKTPSEMTDTVYSHGPFTSLSIEPLDCRNTRVRVSPSVSWANRYEFWKDDTIRLPIQTIIQKWDPNKYVLKAWNDTFGCYGEQRPLGPPPFNYQLTTSWKLSQDCAPSIANLKSNILPVKVKWVIDNKDSLSGKNVNFTFKEPGLKNIMAVAVFDSIDCPDTVYFSLNVNGVKLRSNVLKQGKCLPMTLQLIDTTAGSDNDIHTWIVNDSIMEVNQMLTSFVVGSMTSGDTAIKIKHIVSSPSGCSTEKEFSIPYEGPVVNYEIRRFTVCDTPVFYFKSYPDTSRSKFPLTYHWKTDHGFESQSANANAKFKEMGMHYLTFTITDRNGCSTVYKDSFEVSPNMLAPQFKANPTGRFCPPLECEFTDMSKSFISEINSWEWDFGDGTTSQLRNPKKMYLLPGSYDLTLKITSKSGCTATIKKPGYIIVNGPRGSYDFDRGDACLPHTVEFRGTTMDSATMEWDLGDGVVREGNFFKHTYKLPGRFIPAMILSDTLGCKYTLPPIDTIEVFDYPNAQFNLSGLCLKQPINVSNLSSSKHDNPYLKNTWYLNGKEKTIGNDSILKPDGRGINTIRLIIENIGRCKDTLDKPIRIFAPETDFTVKDKYICLGMPMTLLNASKSDTSIIDFRWDFGDGNHGTGKDVIHRYNLPGAYDIRLIAKDIMNCEDTIFKPGIAIVGDTIEPVPVHIRRASVIGDFRNELVFEAYKSFDFTNYSIYKYSSGSYQKITEITNPLDTVFMDNMVNTLDNSYCYKVRMKNLCLLESPLPITREHCTIETKTKGLFESNEVKWSPYIGFDSIARYEIWRSDNNDRRTYVLLDSVASTANTYLDTNFSCFVSKHYLIKAIQSGGFNEYSNSDTSVGTPHTVNTTKPNLAWRVTVENNDYALLEWKHDAWSRHGIRGYLVEKCFADGRKSNNDQYFDAGITSFDDMSVNVNEQSYVYRMRGIDNCNDTTPWSNFSQTILLSGRFDKASNKPALSWNFYKEWGQGIVRYEIDRMLPNGVFETIASVSNSVNTYIDYSAESGCVPHYIYRVRAISAWHSTYDTLATSTSNHAQVWPESHLFMPNAFSPDLNNINEKFGPNGQYIVKYHISIYNRWGEKLFDSNTCMDAWDGTYKNERCQQDVYMYRIEAVGADNKTYNLHGTFTLLR